MAVKIFRAGGKISTSNNALNCLYANLGMWNNNAIASFPANIGFTPLANDTLQSAILFISANAMNTAATITVKLQQNIATVWTDVAGCTKTLTGLDMTCGETAVLAVNNSASGCAIEFLFGTPAAVTTAASTWRLVVSRSASGLLLTSDGTNPFLVCVGSTASTYVDNTDQIVVVNQPLEIDANTTLLDTTVVGDATRGVCGVIGSNVSGTGTSPYMLLCKTDNISVTTKGLLIFSSYGGPKWDNSGTPLNGCSITFAAGTAGSATTKAGWMGYGVDSVTSSNISRTSYYFNGAVPAVEDTYLTADIAVGASSCTVADTTGWSNGDHIYFGGYATKGFPDVTQHTVTSTSGKTINFTPVLAGAIRRCGTTCTITIASPGVVTPLATAEAYHGLVAGDIIYFSTTGALPTGITAGTAYYVISTGLTTSTFQFSATLNGSAVVTTGSQSGTHTLAVAKYAGRVVRMNGYGIVMSASVNLATFCYMGQANNVYFSGVQLKDVGFSQSTNFNPTSPSFPTTWRSQSVFRHMSHEFTFAPTTVSAIAQLSLNSDGALYDHVNSCRGAFVFVSTNGTDPFLTIQNCIVLACGFSSTTSAIVTCSNASVKVTMTNIHFENVNGAMSLSTCGGLISGCRYWGNNGGNGIARYTTLADVTFLNNIIDNCAGGHQFVTTVVDCVSNGEIFGPTIANSNNDYSFVGSYIKHEFINCKSTISMQTAATMVNTVDGSLIRYAGYAGVSTDNRTFGRYFITQQCGTGLSDTTARTSGGYSLRIAPQSGSFLTSYPQATLQRGVPTGNIQNKTMTVSVWVYINNAAYYAGTHVKPTLNVKYDDLTTVSAVATATAGAWQQLALTFTPVTTAGQIDVWITAATDATTTNQYFYLDDFNVAYPAGIQLNMGTLDLFAHALPVWPPIATVPSLGGVWDETLTGHGISGSFGERLQLLARTTQLGQVWDELLSAHVIVNSFGSHLQRLAQTGQLGQVWDELLPAHVVSNSFGSVLQQATPATDVSQVWTTPIEGVTTAQDLQRLMAAVLLGKSTVVGTTITFRDIADTKDRVVAEVDSSQERTSVTLDPS